MCHSHQTTTPRPLYPGQRPAANDTSHMTTATRAPCQTSSCPARRGLPAPHTPPPPRPSPNLGHACTSSHMSCAAAHLVKPQAVQRVRQPRRHRPRVLRIPHPVQLAHGAQLEEDGAQAVARCLHVCGHRGGSAQGTVRVCGSHWCGCAEGWALPRMQPGPRPCELWVQVKELGGAQSRTSPAPYASPVPFGAAHSAT